MNDTNRAEFEAWNPVRGNVRNTPIGSGDYVDSVRQAQWEGWQAARAQPERVALSDAEIDAIAMKHYGTQATAQEFAFARAIQSAQAEAVIPASKAALSNADGRSQADVIPGKKEILADSE